jgi:hypothetical protein
VARVVRRADGGEHRDYPAVIHSIQDARNSFDDLRARTQLPRKGKYHIEVDQKSDLTMLYVNNTIYAEFRDHARFSDHSTNIDPAQRIDFDRWKPRGTKRKVTIYNGDHFAHGYQNVDFGGSRGKTSSSRR